jgi:outer membrane protein assembly factor BamB
MKNTILVLVLGLAVAPAMRDPASGQEHAAGYWPQWRGPNGLGVSAESGFVTEWTADSNVRWKAEIPGRGHSSPVVWGNRVFLTTAIKGEHVPGRKAPVHLGFDLRPGYLHPDATDGDYKHAAQVLALDAATGDIVWTRTAYDGLMFDDRHRSNTYASPTIATDGRLIYAFFESLGMYAYDFDGALKWKTSLGEIIKAGLGPGTSPVLYERLVILQCDQEMGTGSFIVALDRETGREVWRVDRKNRRSWATPLLVQSGDRVDLVTSGAEVVIAYDPATGAERWRANGTDSHPIPSPVAGRGLVVLSAGSQSKRALAVRLGGTGDLTNTPSVVWRYNKGTAYVASPIVVGEYLYLLSDAGIVTCLKLETGEMVYEGGRVPIPATFRASPVSFGDVVLLTSEEGDTFVLKTGPQHAILRTNSIGEPVWASPALANGTIYIRGDKHLFAIGSQTTPGH